MARTLAELKSYWTGIKRPAIGLAIAEAWMGGIESVRARPPLELEGCGDNSCIVHIGPKKGMGTNGGCRCSERRLRLAVMGLRAELNRVSAIALKEEEV